MNNKQKKIIERLFELMNDYSNLAPYDNYSAEDIENENDWNDFLRREVTEKASNSFVDYSYAEGYLLEALEHTDWSRAFEAAANLGFKLEDMNICKLATALSYEYEMQRLESIKDEVKKLQKEFENAKE